MKIKLRILAVAAGLAIAMIVNTPALASPFNIASITNAPDVLPQVCVATPDGQLQIPGYPIVKFSPDKNPAGDFGRTEKDALGNSYGYGSAILTVFIFNSNGADKSAKTCLIPNGFIASPKTAFNYVAP